MNAERDWLFRCTPLSWPAVCWILTRSYWGERQSAGRASMKRSPTF